MLNELLPLLADIVKVALKTVFGMVALTLALLLVTWRLSGGGKGSVVAVLCVLVLSMVATGFLTLKRSMLTLVIKALGKLRLADRVLGLVLSYDGFVASGLERLPLAQAEATLHKAIAAVRAKLDFQGGIRGYLVRKANERVLGLVETSTLAAFRAEGVNGVDLALVRHALADRLDATFVAQLDSGLTRITVLVVTALVATSVCLSYFLGRAF